MDLLDCWKAHFSELAKSKLDADSAECQVESDLHARSFGHNDQVLDTPFTIEEIENAVKKLKAGNGGGFDGLQPEHIKYVLLIWLQRIFNGIILLEDIPPSLKVGVTIPVFKGKGCDPLNPNNYRGITLTSVIVKCLEIAILSRLSPILQEKGFPHCAQTAYRHDISCADAISQPKKPFSNTSVRVRNQHFAFWTSKKYYFDSVEYTTLLKHLSDIGIN